MRCFFAEPLFRGSSPDVARLRTLKGKVTLETPGARLAAASEYYWIEAYSNIADRNAACHLAGNRDVKYVALEPDDIPSAELNRISCGYGIDHPRFEEIFELTFAIALRNLAQTILSGDNAKVRETQFSIARTHYTITPVSNRGRVRFRIDGLSLFENHDEELLERTAELVEERLLKTARESSIH